MYKYLIIHEDGTPQQIATLTDDDKEAVTAGIICVYQYNTETGRFEELENDGSWDVVLDHYIY